MQKHSSRNIYILQDQLIQSWRKDSLQTTLPLFRQFCLQSNRRSIRTVKYFHPLQKIISECVQHLIVNNNMKLFRDLIPAICQLQLLTNLHRPTWYNFLNQHYLSQIKLMDTKQSDIIYSMILQFGEGESELKHNLRFQTYKYVFNSVLMLEPKSNVKFLFDVQSIHKQLINLLLDEDCEPFMIQKCIKALGERINIHGVNVSARQTEFNYHNSAKFLEYSKLKGFQLSKTHTQFIKNLIQDRPLRRQHSFQDKQLRQKLKQQSSVANSFALAQSIWQMRIQQFLHKHKYIFKSNPLIGIYEYDFILSGIKEKNYKPFEGLDLGDWMTGEVKPQPSLTIDQLKKYTLTNGFGYVKDQVGFEKPIVLFLNGPFHRVNSEEKEFLLQSDIIKINLLTLYGYQHAVVIQYNHWDQLILDYQKENFFSQLIANKIVLPIKKSNSSRQQTVK